jgi:hypothetical protein
MEIKEQQIKESDLNAKSILYFHYLFHQYIIYLKEIL